jgi:hypothetical protein
LELRDQAVQIVNRDGGDEPCEIGAGIRQDDQHAKTALAIGHMHRLKVEAAQGSRGVGKGSGLMHQLRRRLAPVAQREGCRSRVGWIERCRPLTLEIEHVRDDRVLVLPRRHQLRNEPVRFTVDPGVDIGGRAGQISYRRTVVGLVGLRERWQHRTIVLVHPKRICDGQLHLGIGIDQRGLQSGVAAVECLLGESSELEGARHRLSRRTGGTVVKDLQR